MCLVSVVVNTLAFMLEVMGSIPIRDPLKRGKNMSCWCGDLHAGQEPEIMGLIPIQDSLLTIKKISLLLIIILIIENRLNTIY